MSSLNTQIERLNIGTRGSPLALWQANMTASLLRKVHGLSQEQVQIIVLKTSGDKIKGHLSEFGGKGLFTKELEEALLDGRIDLAVHSMKDVPTRGHSDLSIAAVLPREDPRDALIAPPPAASQAPPVKDILTLPMGAKVGTASIRRRAQLARLRPDIQFSLLRGNVGTRLAKLAAGECDATFLASAGLKRLQQEAVITSLIPAQLMLPAPAQGAVGIEVRRSHTLALQAAAALDHFESRIAITAERGFLRALDGSCRTPIAALAEITGNHLAFRAEVLSGDGVLKFQTQGGLDVSRRSEAQIEAALALGLNLGAKVKADIGARILWDD